MFRLFSRVVDTQGLCSSQLYDNDTFYKAFSDDMRSAKQRVYIESPFITERRIRAIIPILRRLRSQEIAITINTRSPEEHDGKYTTQASEAIKAMQVIGITVLYTVKHHRKLAVIDDILWEGSLNILSQYDSCEVMRRIVSPDMVNEMLTFTGVHRYVA